jgi:hypothetical protein
MYAVMTTLISKLTECYIKHTFVVFFFRRTMRKYKRKTENGSTTLDVME